MATFADKWQTLSKAYQDAIKGEQLWSKDIQGVNREMAKMTKDMDQTEIDLSNSCGATRGKKHEDAEGYLAKFTGLATVLKRGGHKATVLGELNGTDKATKPKTHRALKVLATGIDDIAALAEYKQKTFVEQVAAIGHEVTSQERVAQVQAKALLQVKKAVLKALAEVQKVKSNPTPQAWKDLMSAGGTRDLCMALVSLAGAQTKGDFGNVPNALPHKTTTQPWNTGQAKSAVDDTAAANVIQTKVKEWSQIVKAVANDYQAHW